MRLILIVIVFFSVTSYTVSCSYAPTKASSANTKSDNSLIKQFEIANKYAKEQPIDYAKALPILQNLSNKNYAPAQLLLGQINIFKQIDDANITTGFELIEKAAENNYSVAQYYLAQYYFSGVQNSFKIDHNLAVKWLKRSADNGFALAQKQLADIILSNNADNNQINLAIQLYQLASEQKCTTAAASLSYLFLTGNHNIKIDLEKSFHWAKIAAKAGYPDSQHYLGYAYLTGRGVDQDLIKAYAWHSLAVVNGISQAENGLNEILNQLSTKQISQAWTLSAKYAQTYNVVYNEAVSINYFIDLALRSYLNSDYALESK